MGFGPIPARLATVVAERSSRGARWGDCPKKPGTDWSGAHYASYLGPARSPGSLGEPKIRGGWAGRCESCGAKVPWRSRRTTIYGSAGTRQVWDTASGKLEPGCLYWVPDWGGKCYVGWVNCVGTHLHAILPNGHSWDIDSRASNCGSPQDRVHRCWVRHGMPPNVHVDKNGLTCSAGAGSIAVDGYHGFLHHGTFTAG